MPDLEKTVTKTPAQSEVTDSGTKKRGKHEKVKIKKKKKSGKKIVILIVVLVLLAAAAFGVYKLFFTEEERIALTDTTTYGSLDRAIEGSGTTVPLESLAVEAASMTEIEEVFVSEGDYVQIGDLLYTQDDSEIDEEIESLKDTIEDYEDEILEYEEMIIENQDSIEEYTENIADYEEEMSELLEDMAGLTVVAPYSGRITNVSVEEGDNVTSNTQLCTITNDDVMDLTQYFSYAYEDIVYVGMPAVLSVAEQMLNLDAEVTDVSFIQRMSDDGMQCFAVTVEVENPGSLVEGSTAACYLVADDGTKVYPAIEGDLEYGGVENLQPDVSGELAAVYVTDYQSVKKGQALFVISSDSVEEQIENLEKQIENAKKQIDQAESQIETYTERIESTREKIEDAYDEIELVEDSRANYFMTSTIAGKVMYVNVESGDRPMGNPITIYNMQTMTIDVNIDELDVDYLYEGMTVSVYRTSAERTTTYEGVITYISPEATSSSGVATFPATIEIYSNGELSSGVNVTYSVNVGDTEESVLVNVSALRMTDDGQYYLFVKSEEAPANVLDLSDEDVEIPSGFYPVAIEVGSSNSYYIRVLSGVEADTEVFLRYQNTAPSGGDRTSSGVEDEEESSGNFGGMQQGGMPNFGGQQGSMQPGGMQPGNMGGPPS